MTNVTISSPPASSSVAPSLNDIHDIKPPIDIPTGWEWLWWTLGGLVLVAIIIFAIRYWLAKRSKAEIIIEIPPHERARRKLEGALELFEQPKPFCILVSDAVRLYLEERFGLRAPERTTDEFLNELQRSRELTPSQKESLERFLSACDMVKFARYEPGRPDLESLYNSALRLIEETEPQPESSAKVTAETVGNP
jgi:hypothetical protein